jgi:hypothetical protein
MARPKESRRRVEGVAASGAELSSAPGEAFGTSGDESREAIVNSYELDVWRRNKEARRGQFSAAFPAANRAGFSIVRFTTPRPTAVSIAYIGRPVYGSNCCAIFRPR